MNTQNILNSREVKDFNKKQNSQTIINELRAFPARRWAQENSTYSAEAQLLEDPWKTKREMKERTEKKKRAEEMKEIRIAERLRVFKEAPKDKQWKMRGALETGNDPYYTDYEEMCRCRANVTALGKGSL